MSGVAEARRVSWRDRVVCCAGMGIIGSSLLTVEVGRFGLLDLRTCLVLGMGGDERLRQSTGSFHRNEIFGAQHSTQVEPRQAFISSKGAKVQPHEVPTRWFEIPRLRRSLPTPPRFTSDSANAGPTQAVRGVHVVVAESALIPDNDIHCIVSRWESPTAARPAVCSLRFCTLSCSGFPSSPFNLRNCVARKHTTQFFW